MNFEEMLKKQKEFTINPTTNKPQKQRDPKQFYPKTNEKGEADIMLRFMPSKSEEFTAIVKTYYHYIDGYSTICPSTWELNKWAKDCCPICKHNTENWDSLTKEQKSRRKRNMSNYSNVYIIKNPNDPSTEGKVFYYRYGKQILEKLENASTVSEIDKEMGIEPIKPFSFDTDGANFILKVRQTINEKGEIVPTYKDSVFAKPTAFMDGDLKKIEEIWEGCIIDLVEKFYNEEKFRNSFENIEKDFKEKVLGRTYKKVENQPIVEKIKNDFDESVFEDESLKTSNTDSDEVFDDDDLDF